MIVNAFDARKIYKIAHKISEKVLVQVEGATCSGKSSFVSDIWTKLKQRGIDAMVIEEAATKVLIENDSLLEQLVARPHKSKQWKKSKMELQQKILSHQIESLERFAENDAYAVALMDRGGASTAYHTIPLLSCKDKSMIEEICREMGKMSSQIILLSPLGSLHRNSPRYQKTLEEIKLEHIGIKHFINRWRLNCFEITLLERSARVRIGIKCILALLNNMEQ